MYKVVIQSVTLILHRKGIGIHMTGCIFSIEEFSVYDGPGIRTTVFLKGCPLRCTWCHNPEGQTEEPQIVRSPNGCIGCNNCVKAAVKQNGRLVFTEESIKKCPRGLLRTCGEKLDSELLCRRVMKNAVILNNDGGVTFSGGEPFMQSEFLFECLQRLKGKLHTAIQTSGYCSKQVFDTALGLADYFLYDLKLADSAQHKKFTGVPNELILDNFSRLANSGKAFTVRVPLIPGVSDTEENIAGIAKILNDNKVGYAELLPYNKMAGGKYRMLQREYNPGFDETAEVRIREDIFRSYGVEVKVL